MSQSLAKILVHIVFSTKDRASCLSGDVRPHLWRYLAGALNALDSPAIQVGGAADHVHVLCRMSKNIAACKLIEEIKKESSKWLKAAGCGSGRISLANGVRGLLHRPVGCRGNGAVHPAPGGASSAGVVPGRVPKFSGEVRDSLRRAICVGLTVVSPLQGYDNKKRDPGCERFPTRGGAGRVTTTTRPALPRAGSYVTPLGWSCQRHWVTGTTTATTTTGSAGGGTSATRPARTSSLRGWHGQRHTGIPRAALRHRTGGSGSAALWADAADVAGEIVAARAMAGRDRSRSAAANYPSHDHEDGGRCRMPERYRHDRRGAEILGQIQP